MNRLGKLNGKSPLDFEPACEALKESNRKIPSCRKDFDARQQTGKNHLTQYTFLRE